MIVHAYYEEDPRVRREAEALVARGRPVDVIALRRPEDGRDGVLNGVQITRLDIQRHQGAGLWTYLREYLGFLVRAGWTLARASRRRRYAVVQVHSLPDFLVFATLPVKLAGMPVILDLHEAMPEFFKTRFPSVRSPLIHRAVLLQERLSIGFADEVVAVNELMAERLLSLGVPPDKLTIVPNAPNLDLFDPSVHPRRAFREDGALRVIYTGALTPTYELDVAVDAIARLATERPELDSRLELYGRGDSDEPLRARIAALGIADRITFHGRIPLEAVPAAVAAADVGIAPTRLDAFTAVTISAKIFEYGAMGKPVVASRIPLVERTFAPDTVLT
ncbi:MAG: glycosyltransferase, partial [Chloroflexota bacterium]|nr:glycosyltransferase [Chloroflexota bacterium]